MICAQLQGVINIYECHAVVSKQVGKSKITLEQLHTDDKFDEGEENHVVVKFTAMLVDIDKNLLGGQAPVGDRTYYVTAGAEYGSGSFVWVGVLPVTVSLANDVRIGVHFPKWLSI